MLRRTFISAASIFFLRHCASTPLVDTFTQGNNCPATLWFEHQHPAFSGAKETGTGAFCWLAKGHEGPHLFQLFDPGLEHINRKTYTDGR